MADADAMLIGKLNVAASEDGNAYTDPGGIRDAASDFSQYSQRAERQRGGLVPGAAPRPGRGRQPVGGYGGALSPDRPLDDRGGGGGAVAVRGAAGSAG